MTKAISMSSTNEANDGASRNEGLTLRQAALVAGISYLLMPVTFAEFYVFPKLFVPGNIEQTSQNIASHWRLFFVATLCHFVTLILDVIIAWALYVLLAPVNRALSLLTAWFRLIYTAVALSGLLNLVTVFRLLHTPDYRTLFGVQQLHAHVRLLLNSFRYDFSAALVIFGMHLALVGYLIFRSSYIPRLLGIILSLLGVGWIVWSLSPYLYPTAPLVGYIPVAGFGELLFPLWLVIMGWKLPQRSGSGSV
jgi:Domain of unknown function (DUF4386)